ncbi:hypothetical protein L596_000323 [Steinernema carpocapsae]|uniref:Uncharacterized protein n=1 Tax=Steinernema carpocapsae TaxID=34508 RepID=A0A4V6I731_STECR|nr:hypothetical protein L596_000323 [Steinernema carpocapsae]
MHVFIMPLSSIESDCNQRLSSLPLRLERAFADLDERNVSGNGGEGSLDFAARSALHSPTHPSNLCLDLHGIPYSTMSA